MCYICVCFQLVVFIREYIQHKALLMRYSMRLELVCSSKATSWKHTHI